MKGTRTRSSNIYTQTTRDMYLQVIWVWLSQQEKASVNEDQPGGAC
jgi:hypothetical protein